MYTVSAAFSVAIANRKVRMAELVDVELANGTTYRYMNHPKDIVWNAAGDTYSGILPQDYRGPIRYNTDGSFDTVECKLGLIESDFRDYIKKNILEAAQITIRLIRWDAAWAADEEIILFVGQPDLSFNSKTLNICLVSKIDSLNIVVPRDIYQPGCNRYLFDDHCGLSRTDYAYSGTATGGSVTTLIDTTAGTVYHLGFDNGNSSNPIEIGDSLSGDSGGDGLCVRIVYLTASTGYLWYVENTQQFVDDEVITGGGNTVTVSQAAAIYPSFYEQGEIEMITGDNAGEFRPVLSDSGATRTIFWPFPNAVSAGDTYKIYPGCNGTASICLLFGNTTKWRAFPFVPMTEEIIF